MRSDIIAAWWKEERVAYSSWSLYNNYTAHALYPPFGIFVLPTY
jgi:hypothetical protein